MDKDNEIELVQTIQEKDKKIKELEERVKELEYMYENTKGELITRTNKYIELLEKLKDSVPKDKIREIATKLDKATDWLFEEEGSWSYCEPFRDIAKELEELSKEGK